MNVKRRIERLEVARARRTAKPVCEVVVRVLGPGKTLAGAALPGEVVVKVLGPGLSMSDL